MRKKNSTLQKNTNTEEKAVTEGKKDSYQTNKKLAEVNSSRLVIPFNVNGVNSLIKGPSTTHGF